MTRALLSLCLLAALAGTAAAEKKIQVLQADGRADAKIRAKIGATVITLAKATGDSIVPGDITFADAAAAVGCNPDEAACRDEVLGMLAVDEIVITTVTPKPGGVEVAVRRVSKGGAARDATSFVASDKLDKLDAIAPLFAPAAPTPPATPPGPATPPAAPPTSPTITTGTPPRPETGRPEAGQPETGPAAPPTTTDAAPPRSSMSPSGPVDRPGGRRRLQKVGMVGGGALVLVGVVLWASAANVQGDIDAAPVTTQADLIALQDLERRGDSYANLGNLFVIGGLVLGGVSTYYFVKGNRRRATSARLGPAVFHRGGGLALTFGGSP